MLQLIVTIKFSGSSSSTRTVILCIDSGLLETTLDKLLHDGLVTEIRIENFR
jgi:hypothetical protein